MKLKNLFIHNKEILHRSILNIILKTNTNIRIAITITLTNIKTTIIVLYYLEIIEM